MLKLRRTKYGMVWSLATRVLDGVPRVHISGSFIRDQAYLPEGRTELRASRCASCHGYQGLSYVPNSV